MADGAPTNWLDVLKAGIWPLFGILVALFFWGPITGVLRGVSNNLGPTQGIELGPLKIQFSPLSADKLPAPSGEVAAALASLDSSSRLQLIGMDEGVQTVTCSVEGLAPHVGNFRRDQALAFNALVTDKLVTLATEPDTGDDDCLHGMQRAASLTQLGTDTRRYLLRVLESLRFTTKQ